MTRPLVSAIVASYNYAHYLPRTLDSALNQEYPADCLEIVVVDDGSSDDTPAVLADYEARYPGRVRSFRQDNAGYVAATNRAFSEARGELWALLDADDLWPLDKTTKQVEIFERRREVGLVYSDLTVIDGADHVIHPSFWQLGGVRPVQGPGALVPLLAGNNVCGASTIMVRASLREQFAPIPAGVPYVDWWVAMQAAAASELEFLREPRVGYRQHGANLTHNAQGVGLARERIKQTMTRRQTIIHGGAAALPAHALAPAWDAVERDALQAVQAAASVFVDLPRPSSEEAEASRRVGRRAQALQTRGRRTEALRHWLLAAAHDPFNADAREAIKRLGQDPLLDRSAGPDPFAGARSFTVLADARELAATPDALGAFAARFGETDDATLVIYAPGLTAEQTGEMLSGVLARAGLDADAGTDMLALPDPEHGADHEQLVHAADAVLEAGAVDQLRDRYEATVALV